MRRGDLVICNDVIGFVIDVNETEVTVAGKTRTFHFKKDKCAVIAPSHALAALTYRSLLKSCGKELR